MRSWGRRELRNILIGVCAIAAASFALMKISEAARARSKQGTSYVAYNYNAVPIDSVVINGEGGILNVSAYGGGGKEVCCVILPSYWRPGLTVRIKWQSGGHWVRDASGQIVWHNGEQQFVEGTWKERTVEVPPYIGGEGMDMGRFHIFFFPNDDVKVLVNRWGAGHPTSYPGPRDPRKE